MKSITKQKSPTPSKKLLPKKTLQSSTTLNNKNKKQGKDISNSANTNNDDKYIIPEKWEQRISDIRRLRKEIKEDFIRNATRRNVIPKWKEVIQNIQPIDIRLLLVAIKALGDMYVGFDDYETARNLYSFYKIVSFRLELLEETLYAYESLGTVYKFLYQYNKAIKCYKKMIEMSWILNNRSAELRGYDHIGIQYFYLGNKDKAKYYHERFLYGIYEKDSKVKEAVVEKFKNKHYQFFNDDKIFVKPNPSNDELIEQFKRHIMLYENTKMEIDLENYDLLKNQDMMKNSFISDVDMTFQVIHEKYLDENFLEENNSKQQQGKAYGSKKTMFKNSGKSSTKKIGEKNSLMQVDNLILSHLSTKLRDFNNERFEKIFQRFDSLFKESYGGVGKQ
jgi:tetratricopeptide (TPR) repeat protein